MEIVKLLCETGEVAYTVIVTVSKCLDVQLINDRVLVPVLSYGLGKRGNIGNDINGGLSDTSEQQRRILIWVYCQPRPAPLEFDTFAGNQIFNCTYRSFCAFRSNLKVTEVKPEFATSRSKCDRYNDSAVLRCRFFDEPNDILAIDLQEAQILGLQQCCVLSADPIQACNVPFDISRTIPVARLDLVLF